MRIGILGGAFDPIHIGHLVAAQSAYDHAGLDEVWFMPSNVPPLKSQQPLFTAAQRYEMTAAAIADNPSYKVLDLELKREETSYTIDTVNELQQLYPDYSFYWIIGADRINDLLHWKDIYTLATKIGFIGLARPGYELNLYELPPLIHSQVTMVTMPPIDISSSMIRARLQAGESVQFFVPEAVNEILQR
jgi:nicotinate-nucleotide adenylyltransferase